MQTLLRIKIFFFSLQINYELQSEEHNWKMALYLYTTIIYRVESTALHQSTDWLGIWFEQALSQDRLKKNWLNLNKPLSKFEMTSVLSEHMNLSIVYCVTNPLFIFLRNTCQYTFSSLLHGVIHMLLYLTNGTKYIKKIK